MTIFCEKKDLLNESDVEQKLIIHMLTSKPPLGLGYSPSDYRTKPDIRQITIGKGASKKLYFPDYIIVIKGLPLLIIEAKGPGEDLVEAIREARLYAAEINAKFKKGINPCHKIIVSDGLKTMAYAWDSDNLEHDIDFEQVYAESPEYSEFIKFVGKKRLSEFCEKIYGEIRGNSVFQKPLRLLGGKTIQNEELEQNGFGTSLALDYRHVFNPTTIENRVNIVKHAYVTSKRRLKHVEPIHKIIANLKTPTLTLTQAIEDTEKPRELIDKLKDPKVFKHELLLLVGSVGSGKSTFVDYLREVALPPDLSEEIVWLSVDLNIAPLAKDTIYTWIKERLIESLKQAYSKMDFDDIKVLQKVFSQELKKVEKGPAAYFEKGSDKFNELLANEMTKLMGSTEATLKALVRYLCAERGRRLIISLDNCDKRNREDQLLMFDVAKWLQSECECLVFLPLRDTTYDHHRKDPPLDTLVKDLVFRIDPPSLMEVLHKRVTYALSLMGSDTESWLSYDLPNGMHVKYPESERGMYLACILKSLFQTDAFFRRVITGIAGRNIRKGLEIFLDFCKSGHIDESEIFKIRSSKGVHNLPKHIIMRVLLRGNRKYYQDINSNIRNLFFSLPEETVPDPFTRMVILKWLSNRYRERGPSGIFGFHKISRLISDLTPLGHSAEKVRNELINLARTEAVVLESQDVSVVDDEDLVSIAPAGHVHLDLLESVNYLAACSEDIWYRDQELALRISKRISNQLEFRHMSLECDIANAEDMVKYLVEYHKIFICNPGTFLAENKYENLIDLSSYLNAIEKMKRGISIDIEVSRLIQENPPGKLVEGEVVSIQNYGIFLEFGLNAQGFIPISYFTKAGKIVFEDMERGDTITAEIIKYNAAYKRFTVKPIAE